MRSQHSNQEVRVILAHWLTREYLCEIFEGHTESAMDRNLTMAMTECKVLQGNGEAALACTHTTVQGSALQ